jgi:hypothetical protein
MYSNCALVKVLPTVVFAAGGKSVLFMSQHMPSASGPEAT